MIKDDAEMLNLLGFTTGMLNATMYLAASFPHVQSSKLQEKLIMLAHMSSKIILAYEKIS